MSNEQPTGGEPWTEPHALRSTDASGNSEDWENDTYGVRVRYLDESDERLEVFWAVIMIFRWDGKATRDWRDEQWIKDRVVGSDMCAVEFYPPRACVNDPSNATYLWVFRRRPDWLPWREDSAKAWSPEQAFAPQRGWVGAYLGGDA